MGKVFSYAVGIFLSILFVFTIFSILCMSEIVKPTWMVKTKHTIMHVHPEYTVKQSITQYVPVFGNWTPFGKGIDTEETVRYAR
jgi:hypothetical protein